MTDTNELDLVERSLITVVCLLMFFVGGWGLLKPHSLRRGVLDISSRMPDQSRVGPFVAFLNGRYFILLLRIFSLFPIGMGVALLRTIV